MSDPKTILVTGGAGYIGSHTVRALKDAGYRPVVYDNLSSGHREALPDDVTLIEADLGDLPTLRDAVETIQPEAAIHFAAFIEPNDSMNHPRRFYHNNVAKLLNLCDALVDADVKRIVFSSSAAVYGHQEQQPIPEYVDKEPASTYGETKLIGEKILRDYDRAYGLRSISLRYFNACGAHPDGDIGEAHRQKIHLIELAILTALGQRKEIKIFGTDYPTPDGSAIRDYVHVCDLASAHVRALRALEAGADSTAYNVGLGEGFSVRQVIDAVERVTGHELKRREDPRRPGDPATLVADSSRLKKELAWQPEYTDIDSIIKTAWKWHSTHPHDFEDMNRR